MTYADTGRPAAHAEVHVGGRGGQGGVRQGGVRYLAAEADAEGRFRVSVMPGDRTQCLGRRSRRATLPPRRRAAWHGPRGRPSRPSTWRCPAASLIRGKVTEEGTGQPVADAMVYFQPSAPRAARSGGGGWALTKADGSFAFAVGPHPGHLSVQAPGEDYQLQVISSARFYEGPGGRPCGCMRMPSSLTTPGRARRPRRSASRCGGAPR